MIKALPLIMAIGVLTLFSAALSYTEAADDSVKQTNVYPEHFDHQGIVRELQLSERYVIISGLKYKLADRVVVHFPSLETPGTLQMLREGLSVGFNYENSESTYPVIQELWVLSKPVVEH